MRLSENPFFNDVGGMQSAYSNRFIRGYSNGGVILTSKYLRGTRHRKKLYRSVTYRAVINLYYYRPLPEFPRVKNTARIAPLYLIVKHVVWELNYCLQDMATPKKDLVSKLLGGNDIINLTCLLPKSQHPSPSTHCVHTTRYPSAQADANPTKGT